jgi:hypothetical protein
MPRVGLLVADDVGLGKTLVQVWRVGATDGATIAPSQPSRNVPNSRIATSHRSPARVWHELMMERDTRRGDVRGNARGPQLHSEA